MLQLSGDQEIYTAITASLICFLLLCGTSITGNGVFLLGMAKRWKHLNFLGLEINEKVVYMISDAFVLLLLSYNILDSNLSACAAVLNCCPSVGLDEWVRTIALWV